MATSANITTGGVRAFTVKPGAKAVSIANESDTAIRVNLEGAASATTTADTADTGLSIAAGGSLNLSFDGPLTRPLDVFAIHSGSGNKVLTWIPLYQ
ncbi:MAG: hypothetical protein WCL08_00245 [Verrucomicrobiota bacterium]